MTWTLVTGGAGFVGSRLVALLRARGERVRVLDLRAVDDDADSIVGSVTDHTVVERAMRDVDSVFHLAGNAQLWSPREEQFDDVNHRGARVVLAAAQSVNVRRFVHCSSLTTLIGRSTPIGPSMATEASEKPLSDMLGPYPRSKWMADAAVIEAVGQGLDAVIAIPTEPIGPGDISLTPPTKMIRDFALGRTPAYIDCLFNFIPVDSLAEGMIAARERGRRGERYILGGADISMLELLKGIEAVGGAPPPRTRLPYGVALGIAAIETALIARITSNPPRAPLTGVRLAGRQVAFSSDKARRELQWEAAQLKPVLAETVRWLMNEKVAA